jgi:hypothetical protein
MASPHSGNITFIDLTDSKKVDIHISSNLPTIQIYDANTPKYSPNWSNTPLELTATAYVDSTDITSTLTNDSIKWYRQIGSDTYNEISTGNQKLKISNNELIDKNIGWSAGTISYICSIKYNGKSFENKITFARVDTGLNGSDGVDGTGVTILGSYNTLNELHTAHPTGNAGDAYIVDGNLYVWAVDDATWENVGNIKGPAGKDGKDSKNIVLSGDSQVFKVDKSNVITPNTIKITAQAFNTSIASWTYSTNGGRTFLSTAPTGVSRDGNVITIDGSTITSNSITIKASDGEISDIFTVYKAIDGLDGNKGDDGIPAPIAFLTNENVGFNANAHGQITGTTSISTVVAYNGTTKVTPIIGAIDKLPSGMTVAPNNGTAYSNTTPTINNLTVTDLYIDKALTNKVAKDKLINGDSFVVGNYLYKYDSTNQNFKCDTYTLNGVAHPKLIVVDNEIMLTFTITNNSTLGSTSSNNGTISIPVTGPASTVLKFSWSKVNAGATGAPASIVDITPSAYYFKSTTGKDGTFTPEYIYIYPRFQTVTFSKWEYSVNGGVTWVAASGANGLTISTYNSVANTLRIAGTSTLYTDTVTSISFRCVSSNTAVYDTVSIAKLFDVDVEEINTRITDGFVEIKNTTDSISSKVSSTEETVKSINNNITSLTTKVSNAEQKITPTAIVSTVRQSTDYINDLGKKVGTNEIISKINQTAETVTISANKIGLLGATNIPDLTADKIKGGTLTLGGSSATTQSGQLLVKNASNVDVLKVNKDGLVVKSGHLAVAEDFQNSRFDWETETWYTTTNTRQLDLASDYLRMGIYTPSGYSPDMILSDTSLSFKGNAQGIGSWGSFVGHDDNGDFVIQDTVRDNISFRGYGNAKIANIGSDGFNIDVPTMFSGGISFIPIVANTNLNNLKTTGFYKCGLNATATTLVNCPTASAFSLVIEAHAGVKQTLTVYSTTNKPIIYVRNFYSNTWGEWSRLCYAGESSTLWSGAIKNGQTITVNESIRNFKFLSCVIGEATFDLGIVLGTFLDSSVSQLHFGAIFTETSGLAGSDLMGAKFTINSDTSLTLIGCASKVASTLHCRKIVGWR